jgi:hypothetical protein
MRDIAELSQLVGKHLTAAALMVELDAPLDPSMRALEARRYLDRNDFDLMLIDVDELKIVTRSRLRLLTREQLASMVIGFAEGPSRSRLIEQTLPIREVARKLLADTSPLLVVGPGGVTHLVNESRLWRSSRHRRTTLIRGCCRQRHQQAPPHTPQGGMGSPHRPRARRGGATTTRGSRRGGGPGSARLPWNGIAAGSAAQAQARQETALAVAPSKSCLGRRGTPPCTAPCLTPSGHSRRSRSPSRCSNGSPSSSPPLSESQGSSRAKP